MTGPPLNILPVGPWDVFIPYGGLHLVAVCICALMVAAVAAAGRALRVSQEATLRRGLGVFAIVYWGAYNVWWNRNGLDPATGLPLHICDLNGVIAPLALLTLNRWLRATLYFWTFTLTIQAYLQPTLTFGPAYIVFWWFWGAHTIIVTCAVYDLVVLGFRPAWRDLGRAYLVSAAYLAAVVPVNLRLAANYGYIGNPPAGVKIPPFVAALGPWPLRAIIIVALAAAAFALVELPWQRLAARKTT
jgi:hypothetical integral membrane protein (TIGR02206 family)